MSETRKNSDSFTVNSCPKCKCTVTVFKNKVNSPSYEFICPKCDAFLRAKLVQSAENFKVEIVLSDMGMDGTNGSI